MKITALLIAAASILELTTAQPHGRRHHKRGTVVYEQDIIIHYVDQHGKPISTAVERKLYTSTVHPAPKPHTSTIQPAPKLHTSTVQPAPKPVTTHPAPAPAPSPYTGGSASTGSGSTGSGSTGSGSTGAAPAPGYGIVYSPYTATGQCKDQAQVNADFAKINGYPLVRIYGVDCNQVTTVINAAKPKGMKIFAGIYDIGQVSTEASTLIAAAKDNWGMIDTIAVGNEVVNSHSASPAAVVSAVNSARAQLRAASYNGPVVTVDTFIAIIQNPELCQASDYAAANCHAFFAGVDSSDAGPYVAQQKAAVMEACSGKKTVITETGWPHQGSSNSQAVPSKADQDKALASIKSAFSDSPSSAIIFTAFDDMWKTDNQYTYGAEKFWGILGSD